jgi:hypothetical protein
MAACGWTWLDTDSHMTASPPRVLVKRFASSVVSHVSLILREDMFPRAGGECRKMDVPSIPGVP